MSSQELPLRVLAVGAGLGRRSDFDVNLQALAAGPTKRKICVDTTDHWVDRFQQLWRDEHISAQAQADGYIQTNGRRVPEIHSGLV